MKVYTMRLLIMMCFLAGLTNRLMAQDVNYNTDDLKKMKKISADEWKKIRDDAVVKKQRYDGENASDLSLQTQKGRTIIKYDQTLDLKTEVDAVFDCMVSGGQSTAGVPEKRNRTSFRIGPGKYEIKSGIIKRVE